MNRRTFFRVGAAGAVMLGAGALVVRTLAPKVPTAQPPGGVLSADTRAALHKIVPVVLGNAFSADTHTRTQEIDATIDRIDLAVRGLAPTTQKEVQELTMLLTFKPARWALTGIGDWASATPDQVSAFLQKWRTHRLGLIQAAYHALHDLIGGAHYGDAATWARIGYALPAAFREAK
jgi:hypothetical protein